MAAVDDADRRGLHGRVAEEARAEQPAVPVPAVLRVGGRVHAGEPTAAPDVAAERGLLGAVEHVARGAQQQTTASGAAAGP